MLPQVSETTPFWKNSCFLSLRDKSGEFHDPLRKKKVMVYFVGFILQISQNMHPDFWARMLVQL
jgi:hypothetical protein